MPTVTQSQLESALGSAIFIELFDDDGDGSVGSSDTNVAAVLNRADYMKEGWNPNLPSNTIYLHVLHIAMFYSWQRKGRGVPHDVTLNYQEAIDQFKAFKTKHDEVRPNYDCVSQPDDDWFDDISDDEVNS